MMSHWFDERAHALTRAFNRQQLCIHEAAHCAVSLAVGGEVLCVAVGFSPPGSNCLGYARTLEPNTWATMLVKLAGCEAEEIFGNCTLFPRSILDDWKFAQLEAAELVGSFDISATMDRGRRAARDIVAANREAISRLAGVLDERGSLFGDEVQEILGKLHCPAESKYFVMPTGEREQRQTREGTKHDIFYREGWLGLRVPTTQARNSGHRENFFRRTDGTTL